VDRLGPATLNVRRFPVFAGLAASFGT